MYASLLDRTSAIKTYGSQHLFYQALKTGELIKVAHGIYSKDVLVHPWHVAMRLWPSSIVTMDSAFSYWGVSDRIPNQTHLATPRTGARISNPEFKQYFMRDDLLAVGLTTIDYYGQQVRIFNLERMLIELVRNKTSLPFDYYRELIHGYRDCAANMDFMLVDEYANAFSNTETLMTRIQEEVL